MEKAKNFFGNKAANIARGMVSKKKVRYQQDGYDLDLAYINDKIIAMGFPVEGGGLESKYRNPMDQVVRFLEEKHAGHYKVYNLCPKSERDYDYANFHGRVSHFPFDDHNPPLVRTCVKFCQDADAWIQAHPDNIIAVHCKAGKGRTGCMIGCYLQHCGLHPDPNEALTFYGKARVTNGKGVTIPSQARYVRYYSRVMRNEIPAVLPIVRLDVFRMYPVPAHMSEDSSYFVICQNDCEVYNTSRKVVFNTNHGRATPVDYKCKLELCGDVTVEVFDRKTSLPGMPRKKARMFQIAFHTAFIEDGKLVLTRAEIDKANKDPDHFPENFRIECQFSPVVDDPAEPTVTPKALQYLLGAAPVLEEGKLWEQLERNFLVRNPATASAIMQDAPRVGTGAMISAAEFVQSEGARRLCEVLKFRSDTVATAAVCEDLRDGLVYELEIAKGELVSFPTRVFVQANSVEEMLQRVGQSLELLDPFGKVRDLEMTIGENYDVVTSMAQFQVRMIVAVWVKGSKLRAELCAAAADPSKKKARDPKSTAYTTVGDKHTFTGDSSGGGMMSTGDELRMDASAAAEPEPEPEPVGTALGRDPEACKAINRVGASIEVYSRSMQKWMRGQVVALEPNGGVKVNYADDEHAGEKSVDPQNQDEVRPYPTFERGAKVIIYSRTLSKWVDGEVVNVESNGDVTVLYGDGDTQRQKCVDPGDAQSVMRRTEPVAKTVVEEGQPPSPRAAPPPYYIGMDVEIYLGCSWMSGMVCAIGETGLTVRYADSGTQSQKIVSLAEAPAMLRPSSSRPMASSLNRTPVLRAHVGAVDDEVLDLGHGDPSSGGEDPSIEL